MRPQRQQVFRTDAASKLDSLELIAALLERDVTNGRAFIAERGVPLPPGRARRRGRARQHVDLAARASQRARSVASGVSRVARHPRLYGGAVATGAFIVDLVIVLSTAAAGVAVLATAYMLV